MLPTLLEAGLVGRTVVAPVAQPGIAVVEEGRLAKVVVPFALPLDPWVARRRAKMFETEAVLDRVAPPSATDPLDCFPN